LCLLPRKIVCDDSFMSEQAEPDSETLGTGRTHRAERQGRREDLSTHQMRTIGQRRADAEEKLARHLREARHPAGEHPAAAEISADD
jgi:hypothetical protein